MVKNITCLVQFDLRWLVKATKGMSSHTKDLFM